MTPQPSQVLVPAKELAQEHYAEHEGKPFYTKLVDFLSSGAVVAMVWEGGLRISYLFFYPERDR